MFEVWTIGPKSQLDVAATLKRFREKHGHMTQRNLADVLGVPFHTYKGWEIGRRMPYSGLLLRGLWHLHWCLDEDR